MCGMERAEQARPAEGPRSWTTYEPEQEMASGMDAFLSENGRSQYNRFCKGCVPPASRVSERWWCPAHTIFLSDLKSAGIRVQMDEETACGAFRAGEWISRVERQGVSA